MYYHMEIFKNVDVIVTPTTGYEQLSNNRVVCVELHFGFCSLHSMCGSSSFLHFNGILLSLITLALLLLLLLLSLYYLYC